MADFRLTASPAIIAPAVEIGATRLAGVDPVAVQTLVLRPGDPGTLAEEMSRLVAPLPAVGRSGTTPAGEVLLRPARDRAYLLGPPPDTGPATMFYALDQSGFWAMLDLTGAGGRAVLERSWRPDLGNRAFPVGAVARSLIAQIPTMLLRRAEQDYRLMAPRSYAGSLVHALETSLASVL